MDQGTEDYIRENYGYLASFLDIPEVGDILRRTAQQGDPLYHADQEKLQGAIQGTKWWKTNAQSQRNWFTLKQTDPAQAKALQQQSAAKVQTYAQQMGVSLDAKRLAHLSEDINMFGWDDNQLHQAVANEFHYSPTAGAVVPTVDNIKQTADDYLIGLSPDTINSWSKQIIGGTATMDDFKAYAQKYAMRAWTDPDTQKAIEGGMTTKQVLDPYAQKAASLLEIPASDVNFMDNKWSSLLQQKDPKTQLTVQPTISDFASKLMTDGRFGYDSTQGARDQASQLVGQLGQLMGSQG